MAVVVIYIVLGILYESFTLPLTILSGLPAARIRRAAHVAAVQDRAQSLRFVGIIMLIGLVKKNGIMMVDFAVAAQRERGLSPSRGDLRRVPGAFQADHDDHHGRRLVGTLPIALGLGAGAESRRPLGLAVVGGLMVSQLLTLYITPVYFIYIEGARHMGSRGRRTSAGTAPS
jgi:HAE1 family hydrophobic/amphiphilic exporter-1